MSDYRIFGSELSPYSVKVRSYFRYKGLPHEWIPRSPAVQAEFQKYAKLPLVPLVVTPDGEGLQDSTPIIERFEAGHPEPSIVPDDPALRLRLGAARGVRRRVGQQVDVPLSLALSARRLVDRRAHRAADDGRPGHARRGAGARRRRRAHDGRAWASSAPTTRPSPRSRPRSSACSALLEAHLATRPYLFGGRPAMADFGLWGQLYEAATDPTPGAIMRASRPR